MWKMKTVWKYFSLKFFFFVNILNPKKLHNGRFLSQKNVSTFLERRYWSYDKIDMWLRAKFGNSDQIWDVIISCFIGMAEWRLVVSYDRQPYTRFVLYSFPPGNKQVVGLPDIFLCCGLEYCSFVPFCLELLAVFPFCMNGNCNIVFYLSF